jgi:tRNA threonylcarbamoyladenosine biosynthesis protein TsaE
VTKEVDTGLIHYRCSSVEQTIQLGKKLAAFAQAGDCVVLNGDLGAGKTQFAKGFAAGLGVDDDVTSPTFTILFEYVGDELPLLHFDLYRLDEEDDLIDIDFYGLLESGAVALVEWGDKFIGAMPDDRLDIDIRVGEDEVRSITVTGQGERARQIESMLAGA